MNNTSLPLAKKKNKFLGFVGNRYIQFILFAAVVAALPFLSKLGSFLPFNVPGIKSGTLGILASVLFYSISAIGLNLLLGYSGLISLGTAGFIGLGSYVAAYVANDMGMPFIVVILASILIPTCVGLIIGLISLRISGLYLAIATLCVSEILLKTFEQVEFLTGGMQGKKAKYPVIFGVSLTKNGTFVLLAIALLLVMMLTYSLVNGQMGRALHAMRGSEVAAQAMGVSLLKYRLIAFSLATAFSGLAGAMYVYWQNYTYPPLWNLNVSLMVLAAVVIGGFRSIFGTVAGAFVVFAVPDLILKKLPIIGKIDGVAYIFNGILIILVVMFYPQGLAGIPGDLKKLGTWVGKKIAPKTNANQPVKKEGEQDV